MPTRQHPWKWVDSFLQNGSSKQNLNLFFSCYFAEFSSYISPKIVAVSSSQKNLQKDPKSSCFGYHIWISKQPDKELFSSNNKPKKHYSFTPYKPYICCCLRGYKIAPKSGCFQVLIRSRGYHIFLFKTTCVQPYFDLLKYHKS